MSSVQAGRASERVLRAGERMNAIRAEVGRVIVGQEQMVSRLLIGLLADGHLLLEGVPGLAKTLAVRTLAGSLGLKFKRIQFTPDLLPADLTGTLVFNPRDSTFRGLSASICAASLPRATDLRSISDRMAQSSLSESRPSSLLVFSTRNPIARPMRSARASRRSLARPIGSETARAILMPRLSSVILNSSRSGRQRLAASVGVRARTSATRSETVTSTS